MAKESYFPIKDMSDEFLKQYLWEAMEMQDGYLIKAIKAEQKRRFLEEQEDRMTVYAKLQQARVELQKKNIKKNIPRNNIINFSF